MCVFEPARAQPGRSPLAAAHDPPALLEVASVEDSVQNRDGRPASDPPRWGNSSEPQIRQIFQDVDGSDLEALKSLCVQWEVDLSASIAEQNARIDRRKISRSQRQKEMGQLRDRIKRKMVAARL